jgi:hypothetical protein
VITSEFALFDNIWVTFTQAAVVVVVVVWTSIYADFSLLQTAVASAFFGVEVQTFKLTIDSNFRITDARTTCVVEVVVPSTILACFDVDLKARTFASINI